MMQRPRILQERMIGLLCLGLLLFNYPILSLFSVDGMLFGIPIQYVYVFSCWLALILLLALVVRPAAQRASAKRTGSSG